MSGDFEYLGAPLDVVQALMDRAWDDDVDDDTRQLLELGARVLELTLDRCCKLASVIEKTEAGL
jgi:hypothetical protein